MALGHGTTPDDVLTLDEAARIYGFAAQRLRRRVESGGVPGAYEANGIAGDWRIPAESLHILGYRPIADVDDVPGTDDPGGPGGSDNEERLELERQRAELAAERRRLEDLQASLDRERRTLELAVDLLRQAASPKGGDVDLLRRIEALRGQPADDRAAEWRRILDQD